MISRCLSNSKKVKPKEGKALFQVELKLGNTYQTQHNTRASGGIQFQKDIISKIIKGGYITKMNNRMSNITAEVISQKRTCEAGHKVGDKFVIGQQTPSNLCSWAFYTLFPFAEVLQFGGSFPWEKDKDKSIVACPDPDNPVVFELRRC